MRKLLIGLSLAVALAACGVGHGTHRSQVRRADRLERALIQIRTRCPTRLNAPRRSRHRCVVARRTGLPPAAATRQRAERKKLRRLVSVLSKQTRVLGRKLLRYEHAQVGFTPAQLQRVFKTVPTWLHSCTAKFPGPIPRKDTVAILSISPRGRVVRALLPSSPYKRKFTRCVVSQLRRLRFPRPQLGIGVVLRYTVSIPNRDYPYLPAKDRVGRRCRRDADCVLTCRTPGTGCCAVCCRPSHAYNRLFLRRLIKRLPKSCAIKGCPRLPCPQSIVTHTAVCVRRYCRIKRYRNIPVPQKVGK